MPDQELIQMVDIPEFQDDWGPKIGDRYTLDLYPELLLIADPEQFKAMVKAYNHNKRTHIPSIEDMLDKLGGKVSSFFRQSDEELACEQCEDIETLRWGVCVFDSTGITENGGYASTLIKALIKAYMHIEHGKSWKDGEWV